MWYREVIGGNKAPIVDTWWQTETGAIMVSALPGADGDQARPCAGPPARYPDHRPTSREPRSGTATADSS